MNLLSVRAYFAGRLSSMYQYAISHRVRLRQLLPVERDLPWQNKTTSLTARSI